MMDLRLCNAKQRINTFVAKTRLGRHFQLEDSGHQNSRQGARFLTEVNAGLATFFAMAYIISVNSQIVSQSGGTCICTSTTDSTCTTDPAYLQCVEEIKQDLVTATAAIAALSSVVMGLFANLPVALAPGMGLNTWFAYQIVGFHGTGTLSFGTAMTALLISGAIFFLISLCGLRTLLANLIPTTLKIAAGAGIGFYITLIGLTSSAGIGAITPGGINSPLQLGGCTSDLLDQVTGQCTSGIMQSPTMWLGIIVGGLLTVLLLIYRIKGAFIIGILLTSIISWPRNTPLTAFPNTTLGDANFDFFRRVVAFHPIKHILVAYNWHIKEEEVADFVIFIVTLLYVNILDLTGTLYSLSSLPVQNNSTNDDATSTLSQPDKEHLDYSLSQPAYLITSLSICASSLLGLPPPTVFMESGAGIAEGGRTGLTAMTTGLCFMIALFFAPIFASFPAWATGCTLCIVGGMMIMGAAAAAAGASGGRLKYMGDWIPGFLTVVVMPFTCSIAYGLITGIVSYALLNTVVYLLIKFSHGRLTPPDYSSREKLTWTTRKETSQSFAWCRKLVMRRRRSTSRPNTSTTLQSGFSHSIELIGLEKVGVEKESCVGQRGYPSATIGSGRTYGSADSGVTVVERFEV